LQRQEPFRLAAIAKKAANILMAMGQQAFDDTDPEKSTRACN
jgi:hypothetical protein